MAIIHIIITQKSVKIMTSIIIIVLYTPSIGTIGTCIFNVVHLLIFIFHEI